MNPPSQIPLSQDAALVAALAGTAMPFSHSAEDQAERWVRALRLHGRVGTAMQALGVGERPLVRAGEPQPELPGQPPLGDEAIERVFRQAKGLAAERRAAAACTVDLLFALFEIYDGLIDQALYPRGSSCGELIERLPGNEVEAGC